LAETRNFSTLDDRHDPPVIAHLGYQEKDGVRADVDRSYAQAIA